MKLHFKYRAVLFVFLCWLTNMAFAEPVSQKEPQKMVDELSQVVLVAFNEQRTELEADASKILVFANKYILPYVDTEKMARYVMARYWKMATAEQQENFTREFTNTLLRSYAVSLLKLKIEKVEVKPLTVEKPGRVVVPSLITQADGNVTDVSYRAFLDDKSGNWMLYDVTIEGISMLINYRKTYASEFSSKSIVQVIDDMKQKNDAFLFQKVAEAPAENS